MKGAAPVDSFFNKGKDFHVLVDQGKVYAATLNQTKVQSNNNKYYILQVLQSDSNPAHCYFFTRWGRVGKEGQYNCIGPYPAASAIA